MSVRLLGRSNRQSKLFVRAISLTFVLVMCVMSFNTTTVAAFPGSYPPPSDVFYVTITEAEYCDMDGESIENDVHVLLKFDLGYAPTYDFDYFITLTLPSGVSYTYYVRIYAWAEEIYIHNVFYNYATESGDYIVDVDALMYSPSIIWDYDYVIFDPPGGSAGSDPGFGVY